MVAYPYHAPPTTQGKGVSEAARLCQSVPVFIGKIVPSYPQATVGEVVQGWESSLDVPASRVRIPLGLLFSFFFAE